MKQVSNYLSPKIMLNKSILNILSLNASDVTTSTTDMKANEKIRYTRATVGSLLLLFPITYDATTSSIPVNSTAKEQN